MIKQLANESWGKLYLLQVRAGLCPSAVCRGVPRSAAGEEQAKSITIFGWVRPTWCKDNLYVWGVSSSYTWSSPLLLRGRYSWKCWGN